jgi:hypothetical protein
MKVILNVPDEGYSENLYILKHLLLNVCLVHEKEESLYRYSMLLKPIHMQLWIKYA